MKLIDLIGDLLDIQDEIGPEHEVTISFEDCELFYDVAHVDRFNSITVIHSQEPICFEDIQALARRCLRTYDNLPSNRVAALTKLVICD